MNATPAPSPSTNGSRARAAWLGASLAFLAILVAAYALRSIGRAWDQGSPGLHPDERFLVSVLYAIEWPQDFRLYFDTARSPLNPENRGFGFFVYGTLPLFVLRAAYEALGPQAPSFYILGRFFSTLADLFTLLLLFGLGSRLGGRRVGLLAAALYAFAVMPIQQAHFLTFDNYVTLFTFAAVAAAVPIATARADEPVPWRWSVLFGLATGAAMASKVSAAPVAGMLAVAWAIRVWRTPKPARMRALDQAARALLVAGAVAFLAFRVLQPYAFRGPHIWDIRLNPNWVGSLKALKVQASGDADFPPAMQWARRGKLYGLENMVRWGMGWPLGLAVVAAALGLGWRWFRTRRPAWGWLVVWVWGMAYFLWQSSLWNPTMRYFLPAYPPLILLAAYALARVWPGWVRQRGPRLLRWPTARRLVAALPALVVLVGTAAWAWAFTRIYTRPHTRVAASRWFLQHAPAAISLEFRTADGQTYRHPLAFPPGATVTAEMPWQTAWSAPVTGELVAIRFYRVLPDGDAAGAKLAISLYGPQDPAHPIFVSQYILPPEPQPSGPVVRPVQETVLRLPRPVPVQASAIYRLSLRPERGRVRFEGARIVNETSWDDGLPLRVDGYDPFGGLYVGLPSFEMYWDDNEDKRQRFYELLDQGEYLFITSSRQWGSLPRLPERYPLVTMYYYHLMGCPLTIPVEACYNQAQLGMYQGRLGYDLIAVFESPPTLGPWTINDQPADEAFTVYDHPKVFVFRKRADYDPARVRALLGAVDLRYTVHVLPGRAKPYPENLLLTPHLWARQTQGGTWAELFPPHSLINRSQVVAVLAWYALIGLLGWIALPWLKPALGVLDDRGYAVARLAGMLLWAWAVWWLGYAGVSMTRGLVWAVFAGLALAALGHYLRHRRAWADALRHAWPEIRRVELLYAALFALDLFIRWMNPDLWHPWKGGEKPMDFAYFNAVLRSTVVPPFDPWFAKGFINYYYWGFALVGVPVKALGLRPSVAYNLILPTLFASTGLGAYALARALARGMGWPRRHARLAGLAALLGTVLLGNLGTVRMIWVGAQRLVLGEAWATEPWFVRAFAGVLGILRTLAGQPLGYMVGDWYWFPSRIIPAPGHIEPITEFPLFTFLYADLHAHLIALGVTLLALLWAWAAVVRITRWGWSHALGLAGLLGWGGLVIGSLRAINTWDYPTYLALGMAALLYAGWRRAPRSPWGLVRGLAAALALAGLTELLWLPYIHWFAQGYRQVQLWRGPYTPLSAYLWHWGLFYFAAGSWLLWLGVDWLKHVPAARGLAWWRRWRGVVLAAVGGVVLLAALLHAGLGTPIGWLALPPLALALGLMLRPRQPDATRFALALLAAALALTLLVEVIVLVGDLERMNTVFKFYLQAWVMWANVAGLAAVAVGVALSRARGGFRNAWFASLGALVLAAFLFTWVATLDKMRDRMAPEAPHTLDGQAYMRYARYFDMGRWISFAEDYAAMQWLYTHVQGSPVLVEANTVEYRWGSRFAINTGQPSVVGWNWHQRQQRGVVTPANWVTDRVAEVATFYTTTDRAWVEDFLRRYEIQYIIVGQLERAYYPGPGLDKFDQWNGQLWERVFQQGETAIYRVRR